MKFLPRQITAVVGRSRQGKSTLFKFIHRDIDTQKGSIAVDGIEITTILMKSFRRNVCVVSQSLKVVASTIIENL